MSSDPHSGTLHYRCAFDATCVNEVWTEPYPDVSKRIRTWAEDVLAVPRDTFKTKRFLLGGTFRDECPPRSTFETLSRNYNTKGLAPTYWGCRLSHPCAEFSYRRWTHDLTLSCLQPNNFRVVLVSRHSITGYLGEEPEQPAAFVPGVVQSLVTSRHWRCTSGDEVLSDNPVQVFTKYLNTLKKSITSTDRACPIVYVSLSQDSALPMVDIDILANLLCGAAKVYVAENTDADAEIERLLGDFGTWNGGVRVFQPRVNLSHDGDKKRHRFFSPSDIRRIGPDEVTMQIVRACCRRAPVLGPNDITSIQDIVSISRRRRLQEILHSLENNNDSELFELAEDLESQRSELQQKHNALQEESEYVQFQLQLEKEEAVKELAKARFEIQEKKEEARRLYEKLREREKPEETVNTLRNLPTTLEEVLKTVCAIHSSKLDFTDEALESARNSRFKDLSKAWSLLWVLAETAHPMIFSADEPFSEDEFRNRTGIRVSMSEGRQTHRDPKLMRLREQAYEERTIDITPHLKYGSGINSFRVHFAIDQKSGKLVIGHCGDHMKNATTRKIS